MSFRFKPEDFHGILGPQDENGKVVGIWIDNAVAAVANRLLDEHVKTLPEVLGDKYKDTDNAKGGWHLADFTVGTHCARLWDIQEIKPKECEHEPEAVYTYGGGSVHIAAPCVKCGKRLVAEWKEAE